MGTMLRSSPYLVDVRHADKGSSAKQQSVYDTMVTNHREESPYGAMVTGQREGMQFKAQPRACW